MNKARLLNSILLFLSGFVAGIQATGLKYGLPEGSYEVSYGKLVIALFFAVMFSAKSLLDEKY